jgi:hypothetical protein
MPSSSRVGIIIRLEFSPPKRVFALQRRDRLNSVCTPDRLHARLGESKMFHLSFPDQILNRSGDVLDRDAWINAMLIEEIYSISSETL